VVTVKSEAAKGRLQGLVALRDRLATEMDSGTQQPASVAMQLRLVLAEIDELSGAAKKGSVVDELAERRRKRSAPGRRKTARGS
jgi:hypothetical protein